MKKYKTDILYFSVLTFVFIILAALFFGKAGDLIIDCGREAYFPLEVLKGKILYRDIFNIFAPLSYQINALFYYIWGVNLSVLNIAGLINAFVIMLTIYLISRTLTNPLNSLIICFTIMILCFFKTFIQNFIFPYSYALVYAVSSFLISVLLCIYYYIKSKPSLIIASFFFMGMSLAFKYEFTFFLPVLITIICFFKPLSKFNILLSILSFASIPLISFGILFFQGLSFSELIESMQLIFKFASTKTYNTFLHNASGLYFNSANNSAYLSYAQQPLQYFLKCFIIAYLSLFAVNKIFAKNEKLKNYINVFLFSSLIAFLIKNYELKFFIKDLFPFFGFFTVIIVFIMIGYLKFAKKLEIKDKIFLFLSITAIIASAKAFFYIDIDGYGAFLILLPIVVNFIFILNYLPKFFGFIDAKTFQFTFIAMIIATGTIFLDRELNIIKFLTYPVKTERGIIYTTQQKGEVFDNTINFIKKEIPEKSTLLVIPEGLLINFLSERNTYNKFYCLIPNHIETFGEGNIVKELKNKFPDYIITDNIETSWYGYKYFGKDYGLKINNLIIKHYKPVKEFQSKYFSNKEDPHDNLNNLNIKIYKHQNNIGTT